MTLMLSYGEDIGVWAVMYRYALLLTRSIGSKYLLHVSINVSQNILYAQSTLLYIYTLCVNIFYYESQ